MRRGAGRTVVPEAMLPARCGTKALPPACTTPANPVRGSGQVRAGASAGPSSLMAGALTGAVRGIVDDPGFRCAAGTAGALVG